MKTCSFPNCNKRFYALGLCVGHYRKQRYALLSDKQVRQRDQIGNEYKFKGDICKIIIKYKHKKDIICIIDREDYIKVKKYKWHFDAYTLHNALKVPISWVILGKRGTYKNQIVHKNKNGLINCKDNLMIINCHQVAWGRNKYKNNTSGYKGVFCNKGGQTWKSMIMCNKKSYYLGSFNNKILAAQAYNKAAKRLFGKFAHLNDI
jgi:hypothetical protein